MFYDCRYYRTEDSISLWRSSNVTVRRGLIDGNNSPTGVGVMFEQDDPSKHGGVRASASQFCTSFPCRTSCATPKKQSASFAWHEWCHYYIQSRCFHRRMDFSSAKMLTRCTWETAVFLHMVARTFGSLMRDAVTTTAMVGQVDRSRRLDHLCMFDRVQMQLLVSASHWSFHPTLNGPPFQQVLRRRRKWVQIHWNCARAVGLLECMCATACDF